MNIPQIRQEFPLLFQKINGKPLIYLDNAATVQKPRQVIKAIEEYYTTINANVHRGVHTLSQRATLAMEESRKLIQAFINAKEECEINFTSGTTDAINLVAYAMREMLTPDDEIIITEIDHHSNIVPWQLLSQCTGAKIKYIPLLESGALDLQKLDDLLSPNTRIIAFNHVSNALGTLNPVKKIIQKAHSVGAWAFVDGAQAAPHLSIDVQDLDADFYAFSGHKMYAPTGTGILYGKKELLQKLAPYRGGGEMIQTVTMNGSTYADLPFKYEAGTPNICGNIVFSKAIRFMQSIGRENIYKHEQSLLKQTLKGLSDIAKIKVIGENIERSGAISFVFNQPGIHSSDIGMILDKMGIAVRTGHHCCQPIMHKFKISGTVRASFAMYNTHEEVDKLLNGIELAIRMLS